MSNNYKMGFDCATRDKEYTSAGLTVKPVTKSTMDDIDPIIPFRTDDAHTVIALRQTGGKGSNGRKWESPLGNLYMSRKLWIEAHEFGQEMEMIAACAVAEVIQDLLPLAEVTIKHPNDVLVDGEKICGCLVYPKYDNKNAVGKKRAINLGVGVNLAVAPESTQPTTCLADHNCVTSIPDFMEKFDAKFAEILAQYRAEKNFNSVLRRMGFLDENDMLKITDAGGKTIVTQYKGFESIAETNFMIFKSGDMRALRSFQIVSGTQRNATVSRRGPAFREPHA